jgi:hypothetical protein
MYSLWQSCLNAAPRQGVRAQLCKRRLLREFALFPATNHVHRRQHVGQVVCAIAVSDGRCSGAIRNTVQFMTESPSLETALVEAWPNAAVRHVNGWVETNFRRKVQYFHI